MKKNRLGLRFLAIGVVVLFVALLLLFNTNSPWALVSLGLSVLLNTTGLSLLMIRR